MAEKMTAAVAHLTSAHPRTDARIFVKQCRSLARHGYRVTLVTADRGGAGREDGVDIVVVRKAHSRLGRMLRTSELILRKAVQLDADLYHLHDPELIPVGLCLKSLGKKVIFDSHEDVPKQLLSKPYLGTVGRSVLSRSFSVFERYACSLLDGVIAATPAIRDKFLQINRNTVDVNNFPVLGELESGTPWSAKRVEVCYVGAIGANRGIREVVRAFELVRSPARFSLAGRFYEPEVETEVKRYRGWARVNELGSLDRSGVRDVLAASLAGVVTHLPIANEVEALPVKMFEYMAAGIPVIASNFALLREIVEGNDCGICVDPYDSQAIADAIDRLVADPKRCREMGANGRAAVLKRYNWDVEEKKLLAIYSRALAAS